MPEDVQNWPRLFQLPKTNKYRVSVCRLENEKWHEQDTGLAWCERRDKDDTTWLVVEQEKQPAELVMRCLIKAPLSFRKQDMLLFCAAPEEHISVPGAQKYLSDANGLARVAICFQELADCASICDFLIYAAHTWSPGVTLVVQYSSNDSSGDIDLEIVEQPPPLPPLPTSVNAESIVTLILQAQRSQLGREFLAIYLDQKNYLDHMHELFLEIERGETELPASERIRTLWALSDIMKQYFLVGDSYLIDSMVDSNQFVKVIGILEYDRAFGSRKANFRDYYCNHTELKQVVEINDTPVLEKIRRTFRLQFMRDILVRRADDFPFQILKTLIYINHVDIIDSLQNSNTFCDDLFGLFEDSDESVNDTTLESLDHHTTGQSKKDLRQQGLKFINEVIKISKTFTMHQMRVLYENLSYYGLFEILNYAMEDEQPLEPKILVLESLGVLLDFDPQLAARHFRPTIETLTLLICQTFISDTETNSGMVSAMQIQACELLKKLMIEEPKLTTEIFFKNVSQQLTFKKDVITAESIQCILDIISYSYSRVPARTMQLIIEHGLWQRLAVTQLIMENGPGRIPDSRIVIALIRAVQNAMQPAALVDENDDLIEQSKQLIETEIIGKVLDLLLVLGNANQMVHSSCLSLLNTIVEGFLRGQPQFIFVTHWIASERRQDIQKLSKTMPPLNEILQLIESDIKPDREKVRSKATGPTLPTKRQRPANRKRSTSSEFLQTPRSQRPRVQPNRSQNPQRTPIDEVDSGDINLGTTLSDLYDNHSNEGAHHDLLNEDDMSFRENFSELFSHGDESGSAYFDQRSSTSPTSPTSPTVGNTPHHSYWTHASNQPGSGAEKHRTILLHTTISGGRGSGPTD